MATGSSTEEHAMDNAPVTPPRQPGQPRKSRRTPPTARTSALYRDLTKLLERLVTADPVLRERVLAALREGPATVCDTLEVLTGMHEGLHDGIVLFVLDHVDYAALGERLGVPIED